MTEKISRENIEELKKKYPHLEVFDKLGDPLQTNNWLNPFHYYKERERLQALSLPDRLDATLVEVEKTLLMTEDLVLTSVIRPRVNRSYYYNWCEEANASFRIAVRVKTRALAARSDEESKNEAASVPKEK